MHSLFGDCSIIKNKKMGKHFVDVLGMVFTGVVGATENTLALKILELALHVSKFESMKALIH